MTYWHMQLHPDDNSWGKEIELLKKKSLIGLGKSKSEIAYINFQEDMNIDDIVLIKRGSITLALTKVIGHCEDIGVNDENKLDWFRYRRKVEILTTNTQNLPNFPQPRKTLQKAINRYTQSYKYIDNWYQKILNPNIKDKGLKLRSLKIENQGILKDFEINFTHDNKPLPLIVIAGINGSGKTTIFEYLTNLNSNKEFLGKYDIKYQKDGVNIDILDNNKNWGLSESISIEEFLDDIIYIPADNIKSIDLDDLRNLCKSNAIDEEIKEFIQNLNCIDNLIRKYVKYFIYKKGESAFVGYEELQNDIDEIFDGFDLNFQFKEMDEKENVWFENIDTIEDDARFSIDKLSTGEKTLLLKIFKLYLEEPKDKVILIDEPETSLHPSWQNKILKFYENFALQNNCQIIIATHSPHIIGSARSEYIRSLTKEGGQIKVKQYNDGFLDRDTNTIIKTIMEADYISQELEDLHDKYRELFNQNKLDTQEAKDLEKEILKHESPNSSFFQGIAFDRELLE